MIRERVLPMSDPNHGRDHGFRWRSTEISRIEGLSDAVFAFAVTLLVVSLEVPRTFTEVIESMRGFGAFALSFLMLTFIWHGQYVFFRRYGMEDATTIVLNLILLFVVLFYVYPLKFLMGTLFRFGGGVHLVTSSSGPVTPIITDAQWPVLMAVYGAGFTAVYTILATLYAHAYRKRDALQLSAAELVETAFSLIEHILRVVLGLLSLSIIAIGRTIWPASPVLTAIIAGWIYFLAWPAQVVQRVIRVRRRRDLESRSGTDGCSAPDQVHPINS